MKSRTFPLVVAVLFAAITLPAQTLAQGTSLKNTNESRKLRSVLAGGSGNLIASNTETAFIGGGQWNTVASLASGSVIAGGLENKATDVYAAIGGGAYNEANSNYATVSGGQQNKVYSIYAAVGGGYGNIASNSYAVVSGGRLNSASAFAAAIGGGEGNTASGDHTVVPGGAFNVAGGSFSSAGGLYASASLRGQDARASDRFTETGDGQTSVYTLYGTTSDANPLNLMLDLTGADDLLLVANGQTMAFEVLVAARSSTGQSAGYQIRGVIKNVAGTTSMVGVPAATILGEDIFALAWDASVIADSGALVVRVTGAATTIRWVATVRTTEVKFP